MKDQEDDTTIDVLQRQHQVMSLWQLEIPIGIVVAILSPPIAFAFTLKYETEQFSLVYGIILAALGSSLGAMLTPFAQLGRMTKGLCGALFGLLAFAATFAAAILLTIILKG